MCLILIAWRAHPDYPLVVAANRDEYHRRPTAPAGFWPERPDLLAGRDLEAGGTWMGLARNGRFAALTNYRDPARHRASARSRGQLVADYLCGKADPESTLASIGPENYNGFNLLLGDSERLLVYGNIEKSHVELAPGVHGISNAFLDTPWPKVCAGKTALRQSLAALPDETAIRQLLLDDHTYPDDRLPATGVSLEWERRLSAMFIRGQDYGTRSSTVITIDRQAWARFDETSWLANGAFGTRQRFRFQLGS